MQWHNLEQPWAPVPHTQHPLWINDMLQVLQWPSCLQEKGFETHILDLFGNIGSFSLLLSLKVKVVLVARRKEKLAEVNDKMVQRARKCKCKCRWSSPVLLLLILKFKMRSKQTLTNFISPNHPNIQLINIKYFRCWVQSRRRVAAVGSYPATWEASETKSCQLKNYII